MRDRYIYIDTEKERERERKFVQVSGGLLGFGGRGLGKTIYIYV